MGLLVTLALLILFSSMGIIVGGNLLAVTLCLSISHQKLYSQKLIYLLQSPPAAGINIIPHFTCEEAGTERSQIPGLKSGRQQGRRLRPSTGSVCFTV